MLSLSIILQFLLLASNRSIPFFQCTLKWARFAQICVIQKVKKLCKFQFWMLTMNMHICSIWCNSSTTWLYCKKKQKLSIICRKWQNVDAFWLEILTFYLFDFSGFSCFPGPQFPAGNFLVINFLFPVFLPGNVPL